MLRTLSPTLAGPTALHRLLTLRWLSVAVMASAAVAAPSLLDLSIRRAPLLAVTVGLILINLASVGAARKASLATPMVMTAHLAMDLVAWSLYAFFSGGTTNPLISLMLPLVAIGGILLPANHAWGLAGLAIGLYGLVWRIAPPLAVRDAAEGVWWHLAGMAVTFGISAIVVVLFISRLSAALRAREESLAAAREAHLRNARIVALANLAAGTAHELGTPLGTLKLLVGELSCHEGLPPDMTEDLAIMNQQIDRCRTILQALSARTGSLRAEGGRQIFLGPWLTDLVANWRSSRPGAQANLTVTPKFAAQSLVADQTLHQAITNLINNAADADPRKCAVISAEIAPDAIVIRIADQGPGFDRRKDDPSSVASASGLGIGLALAELAITRHGGTLDFAANQHAGTIASVRLPLDS